MVGLEVDRLCQERFGGRMPHMLLQQPRALRQQDRLVGDRIARDARYVFKSAPPLFYRRAGLPQHFERTAEIDRERGKVRGDTQAIAKRSRRSRLLARLVASDAEVEIGDMSKRRLAVHAKPGLIEIDDRSQARLRLQAFGEREQIADRHLNEPGRLERRFAHAVAASPISPASGRLVAALKVFASASAERLVS